MDSVSGMIIFARVVEANSFTVAARRLGLSKSAVSKQIARLEDRLGARLLNRTTRRISPTEVGAAFYERCARVAAEVEEAELAVTRLQAEPRGVLRVNAPMSFGMAHLAPAIAAFMERYPDVRIDLTLNDRVVDLIDEGFDVAVRIGHLADSSLVARRLAPSRLVLCAAPSYVERRGAPATPDDLVNHDCMVYSIVATGEQWTFVGRDGAHHTVRVAARLRVNNGDEMRDIAAAGLGLTILPTFIAADHITNGRLA
ncbi:MAG: LysR family transcriptional regulator, partial [Alphaproteobacteria bacterium]